MENEALVLDLLDWLSMEPRSYESVMDAWRTTCPRLTIWEDTVDANYARLKDGSVVITDAGMDFLARRRDG